MSKESSLLKSIVTLKCPKCRQGDLFINKNMYRFNGFFDMPDHCPKCKQDFLIESGFYLGAMFVSYGLTVAISVAVFVAFAIFDAYSLAPFLITLVLVMILTIPFTFKISRSIWIALSVKYDANAIKDHEAQD